MSKMTKEQKELLEELGGWGGPDEMSAFEAVMWRAEIDPSLRSTTTSVMILDRNPDWNRLYSAHQWLIQAVPRFRQRVVEPALGIGNPVWVEDPDFDLDYHLRRVALPAPGTQRQLFDLAQSLAMAPFDKARSPWEATVIEGLDGGRAAYMLKLHHSTSDGMGVMQLLSRVFSKQREPSNRPPPPRLDKFGPRPPSAQSLTRKQLRKTLLSAPREALGLASSAVKSIRSLARDAEATRQGMEYLASAKKVLGIKPVKGSGLFKRRSLSWRFDGMELPLEDLKAGAKAGGGTLNDAFLAGLIRGFRLYHDEMGVSVAEMPIGFPISLRKEGDPMGGNKFAGSQYAAPLHETDPIALMRNIQRFVRDTRDEPAMDIVIRMMPLITRLPLAAVTAVMGEFTRAQDAQISNVPGLRFPVYMAGAEITHLYPFAPVPGCGMMVVLLTHNGKCCIGVNSDRAAVSEPELLMECLEKGIAEVVALGKPKPRRKTSSSSSKTVSGRKSS